MPWNRPPESKTVKGLETKVSPGAPVAYIPGVAGTAYKDAWDVERAYREGVAKIVWVFRCIDAIAGNQARLPMILRKDNSPDGTIVIGPHQIKQLLNTTPNEGENSFVFRYRLSAQLLMSTRGAFIEVIRDRTGAAQALHLLPPGYTAPIPDPKKFVSGFEVTYPSGDKEILKPENVIWVRRPHPLNPYLSITPLESAGIAIEIETLAKLYNRNFLLNDGRPGGIVVVKGELEDEDRAELKSRFTGGVNRSGAITVLASEEGADFVDTGATPRDAAYIQMRTLTKEEILAAFGVPESIIGNASGRCLRRDELVRLASGERVPAIKLVGEQFRLLTATPEGHVEVDAWATLENYEPIYRTTTESGRTLETNGRHPLYAARYVTTKDMHWRSEKGPGLLDPKWTPVANLTSGHVVAVPSYIEPTAANNLTVDEAFVLGALVGDGTMTGDHKPCGLATPQGEFSDAFIAAVESLDDEVVLDDYEGKVNFWRVRGKAENRPGSGQGARGSVRTRVLLRRVGLMGTTSHTKFIPEDVFMASRQAVAAFLSGYFAADGCISVGLSSTKGQVTTISVATVSERLARDTQELLLRLGVNARIRVKKSRGGIGSTKDKVWTSYEASFSTAEDIINFTDHVTIPGKDTAAIRAIAEAKAAQKPHGGNTQHWRTQNLSPGLRWERVASVEITGEDDTVGIAVPGHHTYLSMFLEHNTFANAAEEGKVFWMETMAPHLELLARGFDALDPLLWVGFETDSVPIMIIAKQQRSEYFLREKQSGLISTNEYRVLTGRKEVRSELADALLDNPNLTPTGNTKKATPPPEAVQQPGAMPLDVMGGQPPGGPPGAPPGGPGMPPTGLGMPLETEGLPSSQQPPVSGQPGTIPGGPTPPTQTLSATPGIEVKRFLPDEDWESQANSNVERWSGIIGHTLERFLERQQRVVLEKAGGAKAKKQLAAKTLSIVQIFDDGVWNKQLQEDFRPVIMGVIAAAAEQVSQKAAVPIDIRSDEQVLMAVDAQVRDTESINSLIMNQLDAAAQVAATLSDEKGEDASVEDKVLLLKAVIASTFADILAKRRDRFAEDAASTAYDTGLRFASEQLDILVN